MRNLEKIGSYLDTLPEAYFVPGGEIQVYENGQLIYEHSFGERCKEENKEKGWYWLYSMTKLYTSVAVLQLYEKGKIRLEQPVTDFFGSLNKQGREAGITLHRLLTMTGGLNYEVNGPALSELREKQEAGKRTGNFSEDVAAAILQDALVYEPGTKFQYSLGLDVLGAVIEVVSGMSLEEYMKKNLFEPLGIENLTFFPTEEQKQRLMPQYCYDWQKPGMVPVGEENQIKIYDGFACGGSGLAGMLPDYIKLPIALSTMGKADNGYQVLLPETIEMMRADQLGAPLNAGLQQYFPNHGLEGYSYGYGVRTRVEYLGSSPVGEFGWDGAAGGYVLVDTKNRLAMGYLQHTVNYGDVYGKIHPTLRQLLYEQE